MLDVTSLSTVLQLMGAFRAQAPLLPDLLVPHLALSGCIHCQTFKVAEDEPHMLHVAAARRIGRVIPLTSSEM